MLLANTSENIFFKVSATFMVKRSIYSTQCRYKRQKAQLKHGYANSLSKCYIFVIFLRVDCFSFEFHKMCRSSLKYKYVPAGQRLRCLLIFPPICFSTVQHEEEVYYYYMYGNYLYTVCFWSFGAASKEDQPPFFISVNIVFQLLW